MKDVFVAENLKSGDRFESVEYGGDNVYIFELVSNADSLAQSTISLKITKNILFQFLLRGLKVM